MRIEREEVTVMKEPVLVIMAAGMGSRYGGLKQIDPMDKGGHILIDFSLYDARKAGFRKVVFIIKKENEADFKAVIGNRIEKSMEVSYVYQDRTLPEGFSVPEGRTKPFGTGHAVLCCAPVIDGPFAVINADDYYGKHAFSLIYEHLAHPVAEEPYHYAMVGYQLERTLTDHGHVARGICAVDADGMLTGITERTHIEKRDGKIQYTEDDGMSWHEIPAGSVVSMNMWGFTESILVELQERFPRFLVENLAKNPLKCEYFLPAVVGALLEEKKAKVTVLRSPDQWYGVTYHEDKPVVEEAIRRMKERGDYPEDF